MSNLKDLLIHVLIETAKAKRKCKGRRRHPISKRIIQKGDKCLRVKTGRLSSSVYCRECSYIMLAEAKEKTESLLSEFDGATNN